MTIKSTTSLCSELEKAIEEGYTNVYVFADGMIHLLLNPDHKFPILSVKINPTPCMSTRQIVYRIETNNGEKGYAVLEFDPGEDF